MTIHEPSNTFLIESAGQEEPSQQVIRSEGSSWFVSSALEESFVSLLPSDPRIERVYWAFEHHILRIWTVINEPNFAFEKQIYGAQMAFLDAFPELECDFSVIYRFGKQFEDCKPLVGNQIHPTL